MKVFALGIFACALGVTATALSAAPAGERVVFEVDLTRGSAGPGQVTGGVWQGGWKTTGVKGERIVFDAGRPIANGRLEVTFTADELPWAAQQGKINYVGLHEDASLSQNRHDGDLFYARTGGPQYKFSCVKAAGRRFDRSEYEPRLGRVEQWICDGKTEMTVALSWRDGVPVFTLPDGVETVFPRDVIGGDTPIDRLRYAFLGSDNFTGLSVKGLCFKRVKLIDHGADVDSPDPTPLRVSENGRGLVDGAGRPVFLLADTAWSLAMRMKREDAEAYLRQRRSQRFNAVTFVLFTPGKTELADGVVNAYGDAPFTMTGNQPDPTQPLVMTGADPANAEHYDYWDHVDYLVKLTRRLGLRAILLPTWGSGVVGSYDGKSREDAVFDARNARVYGRWVAARYQDEPHVIWMMGGDRAAVEGKDDFRPVFRAMAEGIAEGAPGKLLSYHPRKNAPQSGAFFHADPWLAFNSVQDWPEKQIAHMSDDWARSPAKPTWLFEGRYEGYWKNNYKPGDWGEWQIRQQAYQTVLSGAFGHTYGHERVFGFGKDGANWREFMDTPGARSMTHLAKVMNGFGPGDVLNRVPDQALLVGDQGKAERARSNWIGAARTASGRQALFYSASGRPMRVKMEALAAGKMFAWWFNPRSGNWHVDGNETREQKFFTKDLASGPGSGEREFVPPTSGDGQDWLLIVSAGEGI